MTAADRHGLTFADAATGPVAPVPGLGEHTDEVLAALAEPAEPVGDP